MVITNTSISHNKYVIWLNLWLFISLQYCSRKWKVHRWNFHCHRRFIMKRLWEWKFHHGTFTPSDFYSDETLVFMKQTFKQLLLPGTFAPCNCHSFATFVSFISFFHSFFMYLTLKTIVTLKSVYRLVNVI